VITELSAPRYQRTLVPKPKAAAEKRNRHGRPPSRQLESRDRLGNILPASSSLESETTSVARQGK
jgi:hypothetical protein